MKIRMRFIKKGPIQYIGHLDLMRYFQKLFRRCGLDVSYSQGFNPHQILSFASPLGVGLTSIGEYLDASVDSLYVITEKDRPELTTGQWIDRINEYSNDMVIITAFNIMPDDVKPSMSLLAGAAYMVIPGCSTGDGQNIKCADVVDYYNRSSQIIINKKTKKSVSEINLKEGIYLVSDNENDFYGRLKDIAAADEEYEKKALEDIDKNNVLYVFCAAGSALNIKPEMLMEAYCKECSRITVQERFSVLAAACVSASLTNTNPHACNPPEAYQMGDCTPADSSNLLTTCRGGSHLPSDIIRLDMYVKDGDRYISMQLNA